LSLLLCRVCPGFLSFILIHTTQTFMSSTRVRTCNRSNLLAADPRLGPLCHWDRHAIAPPRTSMFMYSRIKIRISCIIQRCLLTSSKKFVCLCGFCER
jgi:hypothetical protein